jgi:hypothetical protein
VAHEQVGPLSARPSHEHLLDAGAEVQRGAADACGAGGDRGVEQRSTCSGAPLMLVISGAINTPVGMPARFGSATASSRVSG